MKELEKLLKELTKLAEKTEKEREKKKKQLEKNMDKIVEAIKLSNSVIVIGDGLFVTMGSENELCNLLANAINQLAKQGVSKDKLALVSPLGLQCGENKKGKK